MTVTTFDAVEAASPPMSSERLRVLLLLTSTAGGGGLHAYYLAKHLCRKRYDLTVAFGPGYPLDAKFDELGVPVVHLSMTRSVSPLRNLQALAQIYRLIRRERFEVVCIGCSMAGFLGRLAATVAGVRHRVFVIHAYASRAYQSKIKRGFYRLIEQSMDFLTTHYVAVSQATRDDGVMAGLISPEKVQVISNGIELPARPALSRRELRKILGFREDSRIVGTAGRFEPQKNIGDFIRAAAIVRRQMPNTEFLIVGDGPLRGELEVLASELGLSDAMKFVGWQKNIAPYLRTMDIFCLTSLWEQFPFVVLEAMAMSTPVVCTNVAGLAEAVENGRAGRLVEPGDVEGTANAVCELLTNEVAADRMARVGLRRVMQRYTVERMVQEYESLFDRLGEGVLCEA